MRRLFWWPLPATLLAVAAAAAQEPATPGEIKQQVTVTAPRSEQPLPELPPDEFNRCMGMVGYETIDYTQGVLCEAQLSREKHIVIEACINEKGDSAPPRIIQACTESLDRNIWFFTQFRGMRPGS